MRMRILSAKRGTIVVRLFHACRELNLRTVAMFAGADAESLRTRFPAECVPDRHPVRDAESSQPRQNLAQRLSRRSEAMPHERASIRGRASASGSIRCA
ncbi:MAG: hypothetical protein HYZ81_00890 [Nitrospinae bacterium]|nr:hypothetical protein [Nitrospinota bacterium]